jgi:putative MATE family efflux protein
MEAAVDPLLRRSPAAAVLRQGLPLAFGLASHAAINLVDLAMVGRLGPAAVQAAHIGSTWNFLPMIVGNCISTALLARLSQQLGQGDRDGALAMNRAGQWFMFVLALVLAVITAVPAEPMVDLMAVDGQVRNDAVHYLFVSNLGCLPMFVLMQTTAAMRAAGEAFVPLVLLLGANLLNLLLAIPLLFGWSALGIEGVGVVGAAYAAVAARTVAAVAAVLWLCRRTHPLSLRAPTRAKIAVARPLLADAWPQSLQIALRASVLLLLTAIVSNRHGQDALVALSITTRFDTVVLFSALGFANAATVYAGRAAAVGRERAARAAGLAAGIAATLFGAVLVVSMITWAPELVALCLPSPAPAVVTAAALYFGIAAWAQVAGAFALGAMGAPQGAGSMRAPLAVDLLGFGGVFLLLWLWADGPLEEIYRTLVFGASWVALLHLAFVRHGRWLAAAHQR